MCAVSKEPDNVSRASIVFSLASLAILFIGFVTGSWVTTREPYKVPGTDMYTAVAFRIGLWKICPTLKKINSTLSFPNLSCKYVRYTSDWDSTLANKDLGIDSDIYFTPSFVARMRWCTPLVAISLCLMLAGCIFSFSGHFCKDQKTLIASSLYTLAGLILAAGLFVFASVLSDSFSSVYLSSRDDVDFSGQVSTNPDYDYRYGWSFIACSLAFLASEASAVFTIIAYFRRLEERMHYTAVDRKPPQSPTLSVTGGTAATGDECSLHSPDHMDQESLDSGLLNSERPTAASTTTSAVVDDSLSGDLNGNTPPDICPPKIGDDLTNSQAGVAVVKQSTSYCSATLNPKHYKHMAVISSGNGYEVDTTKPCTCSSMPVTGSTKRYATIAAGVTRHNGGKQYTAATSMTTAKRKGGATGLTSIKESPMDDYYHHHNQQQHHSKNHQTLSRKPEPPSRRLKAAVGSYCIPQTPIAALEALDCPPIADSRLVTPSLV
ncbi:uncharacterized protein LOC126905573 [Daktulosphaira vitifoliae]|uniref:uncharacterized protein LOC126905573 n=1 Tax=Daktulosphaira vitifoliae TaxID=58002 RepID=UPI0021AA5475|nr:uncharacterized protein LOC126905573 [Daktulosphaira vitifoliae]XP_050541359.1 uncharacterized protein LOC126905573 [Daktulosphaira vitifoliae]XP_050541360.1 uncharacterized protein LOC126905573 [Daktulosphaira vitifoliae]XP_050541361.1 uncharacterized protein LOC126905573 [Daktulosphaira vitifoliae]XP_050541362.1 uncharacterized protein LOC126905573 [Daktulosphaira vitifoliae]XP_050541363.1 uncharacterized protein LOC126905573 [Daktulosphaira vitifoliae]XP_050541364.1 uncharacterized prot